MLPRSHRINGELLKKALPRSKTISSDWGRVRYTSGPSIHCSCIVSKKIAKRAHERNLLHRRTYSVIRNILSEIHSGTYIIYPNKQSFFLKPTDFRIQLRALLHAASSKLS